ncbi:MAG: HD family phosphohydrolase [Puniceicoccaceae bacterium]
MSSSPKRRQSSVSQRVSERARTGAKQSRPDPLNRDYLRRIGAYVFFCLTTLLVSFYGRNFSGPPILEGQIADQRVVAEFPFRFQSQIATDRKISEARERVPPVYTVNRLPYEKFEQFITLLDVKFSQIERPLRQLPSEEREARIREFAEKFISEADFKPDLQSIIQVLSQASSLERNRFLRLGLAALRKVYQNGIIDPNDPNFREIGSYQMIRIQTDDGQTSTIELQRRLDALVSLRLDLMNLELPENLFNPIYRILETGIRPNLHYDPIASQRAEAAVLRNIQPVVFEIQEGETLITPGTLVTPAMYERYVSYLNELAAQSQGRFLFSAAQTQRAFQGLLLLLAFPFFLRSISTRDYYFVLLTLLANIVLLRFWVDLEDSPFFVANPSLIATLRYGAPIALAPILLTVLLRPAISLPAAFLVSFFFGLIHGTTVPVFLTAFLASVIGISSCETTHRRGTIIRSSVAVGAATTLILLAEGLLLNSPLGLIGRGAVLAIIVGFISGFLLLAILPFVERACGITTNITYLEYTDYNHPLLRQMQLEAPGTFHHSLMVASLSENAAVAIGANSLLCRSTSLFHDIGKLVKPEYFIENQAGGVNLLTGKNPSMSALIIKSHVKEGVAIASRYRLPQSFIDIIQQHHGTSLIAYFYHEAKKRSSEAVEESFYYGAALENTDVSESTYRYDGPKPQTVESAIIFIADSVEAASRTLPKINAQSVNELIDKIIRSRIEDHQFDECSITSGQLARIRASFARTLLNSLHTRVRYPDEAEPKALPPAEPAPNDPSAEEETNSTQTKPA